MKFRRNASRAAISVLLALTASVSTQAFGSVSQAFAATHAMQKSNIIVNGKAFSSQYKFVANNTTYMPIYYVQQLINAAFNLDPKSDVWTGHSWNLTITGAKTAIIFKGSGTGIYVNGVLLESAPTLVDIDPSSGQPTTFIPIWYVQQLLNQLLNLDGISDTWDGTNWGLTTQQNIMNGPTKQAMANSIWQVFDATTWDVDRHASMADAGVNITDPTDAVTAADVSTWLSDWAGASKGVTPTWGPKKGQYVPYSLQYETSLDPYTWANENGLFQGTSLTSGSSQVRTADVSQIVSNLEWWLTGDRVVNGVHHLHVPFYSNYLLWYGQGQNGVSLANYQNVLGEVTKYYDEITATMSGTNINLTLPNTTYTSNKLAWDVVDGYWEYGGWQAADNKGGKTIQVPNQGTAGPSIDLATLIPNLYLEGYSISYNNVNGQAVFSQPYSILVDQTPNQ